MVYSGQLYISMPNYNSCTYTAFYLSRIQYILSHLLIANYKHPMREKGGGLSMPCTEAPYEEYPITICGQTIILTNGELAAALFKFRFDEQTYIKTE